MLSTTSRYLQCAAAAALLCLALSAHAERAAFTLSGHVYTESEDSPAAGADLWLAQEAGVLRATADKDGRYSFRVPDAGAFQLVALKAGHAIGGHTGFIVGDAEIDLSLPKGLEVSVQVIGPTSQPLSGAKLVWLNVNGQYNVPVAALNEAGFPAIRSNAEGRLTFPMLPEGGFVRLRLTEFEHADLMVDYLPVREKQPALQMLTGQRIAGRVLSPEEQGVEGARVTVFQVGMNGQREFSNAVSDREGYFHCRVPVGDYTVGVRHREFASPQPSPVTVTPGDADTEAIVKLKKPRRIEGSVQLPDGKPCGGAYISYLKGETVYEETFSGADGSFHMRVASPEGVLRVVPPAGYVTEQFDRIPVAMEEASQITLKPVKLRAIPRLTGLVQDEFSKPVANALIITPNLPDPDRMVTGPDGRFEYVPNYLPEGGVVLLRAEHPQRFEQASALVEFTESREITLTLAPYEPGAKSSAPPVQEGATDGEPADPEPHVPLLGEEAPAWTLGKWFNREPLTLAALKGKVVVLFFWGSFDDSPQGRDAVEQLMTLHSMYAGDDSVVVVGLHDATSTEEEVAAFVEASGLKAPVALDGQRFETFTAYKVTYIPDVVLIDKRGKIRYRQPGDKLMENLKLLRRE